MDNKIPTAKELLAKDYKDSKTIIDSASNLSYIMIEFAKLHVKTALESATNNNAIYCSEEDCYAVTRDNILNAYPESNIK